MAKNNVPTVADSDLSNLSAIVPAGDSSDISNLISTGNQPLPASQAVIDMSRVIQTDRLDSFIYKNVQAEFGKVKELSEDEKVEGLVEDVFQSLYKYNPKFKEGSEKEAQRQMLETMQGLAEYKDMVSTTRMDDVASSFGLMKLAPPMIEQYLTVQEQKEKHEEQNPETPFNIQEHMDPKAMAGMRQAMRGALAEAAEEAEDAQGMAQAWGLGSSEAQQMPFQERIAKLKRIMSNDRLRKMSELYGKFKNMMLSAEAVKYQHGNDEIVDITLGDDISRLLPSEMLKLELTPELFYKDYMEKSLLVYDMKGVEKQGKGPMIVCLDISGSMGGEKIEWAVAVVLALLAVCEKQKRAFGFIPFDDGVHSKKMIFTPAYKLPMTYEQKVKIAEIGVAGGTQFHPALGEAFKLIHKGETDPLKGAVSVDVFRKADIVFITDGVCSISDQHLQIVLEAKKELNTKIYGIGIKDRYETEEQFQECLGKFADQVSFMNSTGEFEVVKGLATSVVAQEE